MLKGGCFNKSVLCKNPAFPCPALAGHVAPKNSIASSSWRRAVIARVRTDSATGQREQQQHFEHSPLEVVEYMPDFVNTACLIGTVMGEITEVRDTSDQIMHGMLRMIVQHPRPGKPSQMDCYEVIFPPGLYDTIKKELRPNDSIYVQGPISIHQAKPSAEQPSKAMLGVISALSIYHVKGNADRFFLASVEIPPSYGSPLATADHGDSNAPSASRSGSSEQAWQAVVDSFDQFYDNRVNKKNPKAPDFKHKTSGEGLWLSDAPAWALQHLQTIPLQKSKDEAWKAVLENPDQFYDNRADKLNPKAPDFKHKVDGGALWMNDAPQWVLDQLLKMPVAQPSSRGVGKDAQWEAVLSSFDQFYDNREGKLNPKSPDFKHKISGEALWLTDAPPWALDGLKAIPAAQNSRRGAGKEAQWEQVLSSFDQFYDNRIDKVNPKGPDFKHKTSGEALWLNDAPQWALDGLQALPAAQSGKGGAGKTAQWEAMLASRDQYFDNRSSKSNPKAPDFKHKISGEALWMNDAPQWVVDQLQAAPVSVGKGGGAKDALWETYLASPDQYYDNRDNKSNPKSPDFKHKTSGEALWMNGAPQWALDQLQAAPASGGKGGAAKDAQWEIYLETPSNYYDNRVNKLNPKSPDFKHKISGEGLWLNDAPQWAVDRI